MSAAHTAPNRDCLSQAQAAKVYPGQFLKYREVGPLRCWFAGRTPDKSEFRIVPPNAEPRDTGAVASSIQWTPVDRLHSDVGALQQDVVGATVRPVETTKEPKGAADDLIGLEGTLCPGPCEDLRTIDPKELRRRLEAAHAAFVKYWTTTFDERWTLR
jgi:hypothetical protein